MNFITLKELKKMVPVASESMAMQIYFLLYAVSGNPLYDIQCYLPYMVAVAMGIATVNKIKKNNKEVRCEEIR